MKYGGYLERLQKLKQQDIKLDIMLTQNNGIKTADAICHEIEEMFRINQSQQ